jgi:hypothetical protein
VLRATGQTETMQENIQDWLMMDEVDPGSAFDTGRNFCSDIFLFIFMSTILFKFPIYLFSELFCFCF